jgi:hypothetical protein
MKYLHDRHARKYESPLQQYHESFASAEVLRPPELPGRRYRVTNGPQHIFTVPTGCPGVHHQHQDHDAVVERGQHRTGGCAPERELERPIAPGGVAWRLHLRVDSRDAGARPVRHTQDGDDRGLPVQILAHSSPTAGTDDHALRRLPGACAARCAGKQRFVERLDFVLTWFGHGRCGTTAHRVPPFPRRTASTFPSGRASERAFAAVNL